MVDRSFRGPFHHLASSMSFLDSFKRAFGGKQSARPHRAPRSSATSASKRAPMAAVAPKHPQLRGSDIKRVLGEVLQDTMLHAGLLSAEYSLKVLTTVGDQGKHVMVVNLTRAMPGGLEQMASAERLIALLASSRFGLEVTAVYWRVASLVAAVPSGALGAVAASMRAAAKPAPVQALPLEARRPRFYDDEPGYQDPKTEFPRTRPADSDLMGLFP